MTPSKFEASESWRPPTAKDAPTNGPPQPPGSDGLALPRSPLRWEYQWEDALNAISTREVEPQLATRIVNEVTRAGAAQAEACVVFVRGELGIGKSTLARLVRTHLKEAAASTGEDRIKNALLTCVVMEAGDLESATDFAKRINNRLSQAPSAIVLARPGALDAAAQWIRASPNAMVTMRAFAPGSPLFHECLEHVAASVGLTSDGRREQLSAVASRLPDFLQTPFYFEQLATALVASDEAGLAIERSPLELFQSSLETRSRSSPCWACLPSSPTSICSGWPVCCLR